MVRITSSYHHRGLIAQQLDESLTFHFVSMLLGIFSSRSTVATVSTHWLLFSGAEPSAQQLYYCIKLASVYFFYFRGVFVFPPQFTAAEQLTPERRQ
jgi:hypothetical protein